MSSSPIPVGFLKKSHGIRGDLVLHCFLDRPKEYLGKAPLFFSDHSPVVLTNYRLLKDKQWVVHIKGVENRDAADILKGQEIWMDGDPLVQENQDDGEFYYSQLEGCDVFNETQEALGIVCGVHNFGASDILEIKSLDGEKFMVPFIKDAVLTVDVGKREIVIHSSYKVV
jgi:16S rRNA processing protein RimM